MLNGDKPGYSGLRIEQKDVKPKIKIFLFIFFLVLMGGLAALYYVFNKPHRTAENEDAITIPAVELFASFQQNEQKANAAYLDKAIQVIGEINEVKSNQEGRMVVVLKSRDPFFGVVCTLKEKVATLRTGQKINVVGLCSGYNGDVVLRDCLIRNN